MVIISSGEPASNMATQVSSSEPLHNDGNAKMCNGGTKSEFNGNGEAETNERNDSKQVRNKHSRIIYNKDFLLDCSKSPNSKRKPADFPLPDLGCTLSSMKLLKPSTPVVPPVYVAPRRKDEVPVRRDPCDNISLRPHSGSFAGGCSPVFPGRSSRENRETSGFRGDTRSFRGDRDAGDRDRGDRRGDRDPVDRDRGDRRGDRDPVDRDRCDRRGDRDPADRGDRSGDRDPADRGDRRGDRDPADRGDRRGDRDPADRGDRRGDRERPTRDIRPDVRPFHSRWGDSNGIWDDPPHQETQGKWNYHVAKNGRGDGLGPSGHYEKKEHGHRDYRRGREHRDEQEEPEWFSGGPTSRHETMELRGFMDDERKDTEEKRSRKEFAANRPFEPEAPPIKPPSQEAEPSMDMNLSLDKILKMDSIPGLENGFEEDLEEEEEEEYKPEEQPLSKSRFAKIFQRNSANENNPPRGEQDGKFLFDQLQSTSDGPLISNPVEQKHEMVEELGNALRSMLHISNQHAQTLRDNEARTRGEIPVTQQSPQSQIPMPNNPNLISSPPNQNLHQLDKQQHAHDVHLLQALLQQIILVPGSNNKPESSNRSPSLSPCTSPIDRDNSTFPRPGSGMGRPGTCHGIPVSFIARPGSGLNTPLGCYEISPGFVPPHRPEFFQQMPQNMMRPPMQYGNVGFRPVHNGMPMVHPQQMVQQMPFNVLESLVRPNIPQHNMIIPREAYTPQQVMGMLPPDIQLLVQNVNVDEDFWSVHEHRPILSAISCGQFSFRSLIQDLLNPSCPRKPMFAALLQLILAGYLSIPSFSLIGQPANFRKGPPPSHPHPVMMHRVHQPQNNRNGRPDYDVEQSRRNSGTPVPCNMAFTPTSVMRKMTADSPKPTNQNRRLTPNGPPGSELSGADFNVLVQHLTGQQPQVQIANPMPMHAAQFQPIHSLGQFMMPQPGPPMMHSFQVPAPQSVMNLQNQHHDMPHS